MKSLYAAASAIGLGILGIAASRAVFPQAPVAPAGASVKRPEIHHDDTEVCWIISGRLRLVLPHETFELDERVSIQFDAILEHTYEALTDCRLIILHLRKDKRY